MLLTQMLDTRVLLPCDAWQHMRPAHAQNKTAHTAMIHWVHCVDTFTCRGHSVVLQWACESLITLLALQWTLGDETSMGFSLCRRIKVGAC